MPNSRESSVWRTLAVAFGDGLAFGVALSLTNNAARIATSKSSPPAPDIRPLTDRLTEVEHRIERARITGTVPATGTIEPPGAKLSEAVLTAIDGRFGVIGGQIDRRLAELEARIKSELESHDRSQTEGLDARAEVLRGELTAAIEAQRASMESDMRTFRSQMMDVHREFAGTLAQIVDEQIEQTVNRKLEPIQEQLRLAIQQESLQARSELATSVEALIESRFQALRQQMVGKDREIADLRVRVQGQDQNLLELILALGQSCLHAAERISPPTVSPNEPPTDTPSPNASPPSPVSGGNGVTSDTLIAHADTSDLPAFARPEARKTLWRVPFVSSFLIATTGLLALHYLVV